MAGEDPPGVAGHGRAGPVPGLREEARTFFRLSPGGCYAIRRGDIIRRFDSYSNHPRFKALFARINGGRYPAQSFDVLSTEIFSGTTPLAKGDAYCGPDEGIPFVRSGQVVGDGSVSLVHDVWLRPEIHEGVMKRSQLRRDDLLIAIVGATIGAAGIYDSDDPANINQAIAAVRFRADAVQPRFAVAWLQTSAGQGNLDYLKRPVARANINLEEIAEIVVPVPKPPKQRELLTALDAARAARRRKLEEAESLLGGLDAFVLEALGLTLPPPDGRTVYAVRSAEVTPTRLDVGFYRPFLRKTEAAIRGLACGFERLGSLLREPPLNGLDAREFADSGQRYLRVQNVRPFDLSFDDVKYVDVDTEKDVALAAGDVLLTRKGTFGVAAIVPPSATDCLISSEVMLLRPRPGVSVSADFLVVWINSTACQTLLSRHKTGAIMGHLTQHVVEDLPVPVPDPTTQKKIAAEVSRRRDAARGLRQDALRRWDDAKRRFEEALLGPQPQAKNGGR